MEGNLGLEKNVLINKGQLKTSVESSNEKFLCLVLKLSTGPISVTNNFRWDKKSHLKLPRQPKFP